MREDPPPLSPPGDDDPDGDQVSKEQT